MSVVVNTNISSLNASRSMATTRVDLERAMERLSSGKRLNSSRDDAAGMSVVTRMTSQIQGLNMAVRNANDGISMANTYDGAAEEVGNVLTRMRELAVQMSNGTYAAADRTNADKEFQALTNEIDRIADHTRWNGDVVTNTASLTTALQVDANDSSTGNIDLTFASLKSADLGLSSDAVDTDAKALTAIGNIDTALSALNDNRAAVGSVVNRLEHTVSVLMNTVQRTEESRSRVQDTDFAAESANMARANVLSQAGTAMLAQANQAPQYVLQLLKG
jgi:flagellin